MGTVIASASDAIQNLQGWIASSLALLAMTEKTHLHILAACFARALPIHVPQKTEGAGKAGCVAHPQPRVRKNGGHELSHHRYAGAIRPSLRDWF